MQMLRVSNIFMIYLTLFSSKILRKGIKFGILASWNESLLM